MMLPPGHGRFGRALRAFKAARLLRPGVQRASQADLPRDRMGRDGSAPLARLVADQLFSRIAGVGRVQGNALRLLRDGAENYPAWLAAIEGARRWVHFENYIIRNDATGRMFAAALIAKAQDGVPVRVLFDWMGCIGTGPWFWRRLRRAGVEVRCFNRPRLDSPFGWLSRNHRKCVSVDGTVGFVAGLCVGEVWAPDASGKRVAWRDTGVELRGPAVADLEAAFAESWSHAGGVLPAGMVVSGEAVGEVALRVIAAKPNTMGVYRLDQMIGAIARRSLWLTDAYFVGTTSFIRTLCGAAEDGVDVRLLVPGASDLPVAKALSRAGYRPLLEAGVRVFEWDGPMLHAKTAVADGKWARIGSSNLNLASWMGNWELDVAIEDEGFAEQMQAMFLEDLEHATEVVLEPGTLRTATVTTGKARRSRERGAQRGQLRRGSPGRLAAGAVGLGSAVTAAITNHRTLGPAEAVVMGAAGALLLALAAVSVVIPRVVTIPLAVLAAWIAVTLLVRAGRLSLLREREGPPAMSVREPQAMSVREPPA